MMPRLQLGQQRARAPPAGAARGTGHLHGCVYLARSTRLGESPLGISAAAFLGLLEAVVVLGCAGMTALHNLILPKSLALAYMGCRPEDARLYDALLQPCFQPLIR